MIGSPFPAFCTVDSAIPVAFAIFAMPKGKNEQIDRLVGESGSVLGDFVPDHASEIDATEERVWQEQLAVVMGALLAELPEDQRDILHRRYWLGQNYKQIAEQRGETADRIRAGERQGIRTLRTPKKREHLLPFAAFDCYHGTGLSAYRSTGVSIQEQYMLWREYPRKKAGSTTPPGVSPRLQSEPAPVNMPSRDFAELNSLLIGKANL